MKDKELAVKEYLEMIKESWTWARLTQEERDKFEHNILKHPCSAVVIKGDYEQRWAACEALYHTFLEGLEYDPLHWREDGTKKTTYFEIRYNRPDYEVPPLQILTEAGAKKLVETVKKEKRNHNITLYKVETTYIPMEVK